MYTTLQTLKGLFVRRTNQQTFMWPHQFTSLGESLAQGNRKDVYYNKVFCTIILYIVVCLIFWKQSTLIHSRLELQFCQFLQTLYFCLLGNILVMKFIGLSLSTE